MFKLVSKQIILILNRTFYTGTLQLKINKHTFMFLLPYQTKNKWATFSK